MKQYLFFKSCQVASHQVILRYIISWYISAHIIESGSTARTSCPCSSFEPITFSFNPSFNCFSWWENKRKSSFKWTLQPPDKTVRRTPNRDNITHKLFWLIFGCTLYCAWFLFYFASCFLFLIRQKGNIIAPFLLRVFLDAADVQRQPE